MDREEQTCPCNEVTNMKSKNLLKQKDRIMPGQFLLPQSLRQLSGNSSNGPSLLPWQNDLYMCFTKLGSWLTALRVFDFQLNAVCVLISFRSSYVCAHSLRFMNLIVQMTGTDDGGRASDERTSGRAMDI